MLLCNCVYSLLWTFFFPAQLCKLQQLAWSLSPGVCSAFGIWCAQTEASLPFRGFWVQKRYTGTKRWVKKVSCLEIVGDCQVTHWFGSSTFDFTLILSIQRDNMCSKVSPSHTFTQFPSKSVSSCGQCDAKVWFTPKMCSQGVITITAPHYFIQLVPYSAYIYIQGILCHQKNRMQIGQKLNDFPYECEKWPSVKRGGNILYDQNHQAVFWP